VEKRRIGSLDVSVAGLGCNNFGWRIDAAAAAKVVDAAIDAGINFFDTADIYGGGRSEEFLGRALGSRRREIVLASKFGMKMDEQRRGAKPAYIKQALEDTLRRLRTDHVDLYQLHQPDPDTPIGDTLAALDELVKAGKVREVGCSNFTAAQIREAAAAVRPGAPRFVSVQNEYSLLRRDPEKEVLGECIRHGLAFIPYFPLASGLLTGKYRRGQPMPEGSRGDSAWGPKVFTEENLEIVEKLRAFAESTARSLLELAISWLLTRPTVVSVIAGATSAEQVKANAAAVSWKLTPDDLVQVDRILSGTVTHSRAG
jgi:aryl-alcohol dehydrogenase-like predicted oxidoreductase